MAGLVGNLGKGAGERMVIRNAENGDGDAALENLKGEEMAIRNAENCDGDAALENLKGEENLGQELLNSSSSTSSLNKSSNTLNALSLNKCADKKDSKEPHPRGFSYPYGYIPTKGMENSFTDYSKAMNNEQLKEAKAEFEMWAAAQGKVYASKEDRERRFLIFLLNRKRIERKWIEPLANQGGYFWSNNGRDWQGMDLLWWETGSPDGAECTCKCEEFCHCGEGCCCMGWCICEEYYEEVCG